MAYPTQLRSDSVEHPHYPDYHTRSNGRVVVPVSRTSLFSIEWPSQASSSAYVVKPLDFSGRVFERPLRSLSDQESPKLSEKATLFLSGVLRQLSSAPYKGIDKRRPYPVSALVNAVKVAIGEQNLNILLEKAAFTESKLPCHEILSEILKCFRGRLTDDEKDNFLYFSCKLLHQAQIHETISSYEIIEELIPHLQSVNPCVMKNFNKLLKENLNIFYAAKLIKWVLDHTRGDFLSNAILECAYGYPWFLDTSLFITFICLAIRKPGQDEENKKTLLKLLVEVVGVCHPELRYSCSTNYLEKTINHALYSEDREIKEAANKINQCVVAKRSNSSGSNFSSSLLAVSFESPFSSSDDPHYSSFTQRRGSLLSQGSGDLSEEYFDRLNHQTSRSPISFEDRLKFWNFRSSPDEARPFSHDLFRTAFRLIRNIPLAEFYSMSWDSEVQAPRIIEALNFFHKLESLVVSRVLSFDKIEECSRAIAFFLKVGRKSLEVNDYFCPHAIIKALDHDAIRRMEKTFQYLSAEAKEDLIYLRAIFNSENNYPLLRERLALPDMEWEAPFKIPTKPIILPLSIYLADLKNIAARSSLIEGGEMNYLALREFSITAWQIVWSQRVPPEVVMPETDISKWTWEVTADRDRMMEKSKKLESSNKKN